MNVAIVIKANDKSIETFIKNHIDKLPFKIFVFYGLSFPYKYDGYTDNKIKRFYYKVHSYIRNKQGKQLYEKKMFAKHLNKFKIDVVLAEYLNTASKLTAVCKAKNIPLVATALGYDISVTSILEINKESYKSLFDYASRIIIVSNHMKINLKKFGCSLDKVVYSPAGPSGLFFEIRPDFESFQLFSLGRFVDKKAPYLTLMAFYHAQQIEPRLTLIMGGDGPLLHVCKDLVTTLKIENKVKFIGRINQELQRTILENSLLFIQHSKVAPNGDSEGTPVAILEASAAGLPIISTLHAGIPEVVTHLKTGLLSAEGDVFEMSQNIIKFTKDKILAKKMGQSGRTQVKRNYSLDKHIETIAAEIKSIKTPHNVI